MSNFNVMCLNDSELTMDFIEPRSRAQRENSVFDAFHSFFSNLKSFFGAKPKGFEEKKKRVKSAFTKFFEEINKTPSQPGDPRALEAQYFGSGAAGPRLRNFYSRRVFNIKPETSADQLITAHGYRVESHTVLTADGYMITMQRVLPESGKIPKRAVLLNHGLFGCAEDWLFLGRDRALPYMLADTGYDVWLLNARGNRYSRMHTNKSKERTDFWDFSFHEMGVYDLPAVITYISEITNKAELNYVGHSMGGTALLVLLSRIPEYNFILRSAILLAPLVFMYHVKGPIRLLTDFYNRNGQSSLNFLGQTDFLPDGLFPEQIVERYCKGEERLCLNPLLLLANGGRELVSEEIIENILSHTPAGGSVKTIIHYVQLVKSGYFQMYDYGASNNIRKYGNSTAPFYDLTKVTVPMAFFSSPADWLSTRSDLQTLIPLLQDVNVHHVVKANEFGHLDFLWSEDAPDLVYNFVLTILDQIIPKQDDFFKP